MPEEIERRRCKIDSRAYRDSVQNEGHLVSNIGFDRGHVALMLRRSGILDGVGDCATHQHAGDLYLVRRAASLIREGSDCPRYGVLDLLKQFSAGPISGQHGFRLHHALGAGTDGADKQTRGPDSSIV